MEVRSRHKVGDDGRGNGVVGDESALGDGLKLCENGCCHTRLKWPDMLSKSCGNMGSWTKRRLLDARIIGEHNLVITVGA